MAGRASAGTAAPRRTREPRPTPSSPDPAVAPPTPAKSSAGRPSKLETRAWDIYSATANISMTVAQRRDKFREAVVLAEDFERFWKART